MSTKRGEGHIKKAASEIVEHLTSDRLTTIFYAYLENVMISDSDIVLQQDTRLKKLPVDELKHLYNHDSIFREFYTDQWNRWDKQLWRVGTRIEYSVTNQKEVGKATPNQHRKSFLDGERQVAGVIDALRLFLPAPLNASPVVRVTRFYPFKNIEYKRDRNHYHHYQKCNEIASDLTHDLRAIQKGIARRNESEPRLSGLLRRLDIAAKRDLFEDKVIDLFIAIEMFVHCISNDPEDNIFTNRHNLQALFMNVLSPQSEDKQFVKDVVIGAYKIRSRIVHSKAQLQQEELTIRRMERVFRFALRTYIEDQKPNYAKSFREWIDRANTD